MSLSLRFPKILLLAAWFVPFTAQSQSIEKRDFNQRPNIIIIVSDDQGWADIGYNNPESVPTPNLDALAAGGARLAQHYAHPQCTSTRVALLTGRYPSRWGRQAQSANNAQAFPHGTTTISSLLDDLGYDTFLAGKWHLGSRPEWGPLHHGFDSAYGSFTGAVGMYDHRYREGEFEETWHRDHKIIPGFENGTHVTDLTAREATGFISEERENPFFLYVPFHAPHTPLDERGSFTEQPMERDPDNPDRWLNEDEIPTFNDPDGLIQSEPDPEKRLFLAMVYHMDQAVGKIVDALEKSGQRENTLILFTSDNGPQVNWPANTYPDDIGGTDFNQPDHLRGAKLDVYEGGIHVPAFFNWPGVIEPKTIEEPVHVIDWLPTIANLVGVEAEENWDGEDLAPLISGTGSLGERTLYWLSKNTAPTSDSARWALRHGEYKIVRYGSEPQKAEDWELYNLADDPSEETNLADEKPRVLAKMHQHFLEERAQDRPNSARMVSPTLRGPETVSEPFNVEVSFTVKVTGLSADDFSIQGGTATELTGKGGRYQLEVEPDLRRDGEITIKLPAGAANPDEPNVLSNTLRVRYKR